MPRSPYVDYAPPPPSGQLGDLSGPLFLDAPRSDGGIDPAAWYYYLAGQFENGPGLAVDLPEIPPSATSPAGPGSDPFVGPPVLPPEPPPADPERPEGPPGRRPGSGTLFPEPDDIPPLGEPLGPGTVIGTRPDLVLGVVGPAVLPGRAAREAERTARIEQLEREAASDFDKLLQKPTRVPSEFEKLLKLPRRAVRKMARVPRVFGDVIGGELGVLLPTIFFPDEQRRQEEAARESAVQKAIADAARVATLPRPWTRTRNDSSPSARTSNSRRPIAPAPPAPPAVPSLPGLSNEQLSRVLGEPSASTLPDVAGPELARREVPTFPRLPIRQGRRALPLPWRSALPFFRPQVASLSGLQPLANAAPVAPAPAPAPFSPQLPQLPPPSLAGPDASVDTSVRPLPQPLTASNASLVPSTRDCTCERPTPRPSDKVPTVRSYKRRMSQNSLDNLLRGSR